MGTIRVLWNFDSRCAASVPEIDIGEREPGELAAAHPVM